MNQQIFDYLQQNKTNYSKESLVQQLRISGYVENDIREAVHIAYGTELEPNVATTNIHAQQTNIATRNAAPIEKFFIGGIGWFVMFILSFILILLLGKYLFDFSWVIEQGLVFVFASVVFILQVIPWLIYQSLNLHIAIEDNKIILPQQYNFGTTSTIGIEPIIALSRKRKILEIVDILSCDLEVGLISTGAYERKGLRATAQPLTIILKDGASYVINLKAYSKKTVINLLRRIREINPQIVFSERCEKLIN